MKNEDDDLYHDRSSLATNLLFLFFTIIYLVIFVFIIWTIWLMPTIMLTREIPLHLTEVSIDADILIKFRIFSLLSILLRANALFFTRYLFN